MKQLTCGVTLALLLGSASGTDAHRSSQSFLLEDAKQERWCAYGNKSLWTSDVQSFAASVVATVEYSGDHLSKISVTEEDEAGDWIVYDHYAVGEKGNILGLNRIINILPGDRSEEETYIVVNGKAKKQSSISRKLSTKEVLTVQKEKDWLPDVPIVTRLSDFPFASLIIGKRVRVSLSEKKCVPLKK